MKLVPFLLILPLVNGLPYYYQRDRNAKKSNRKVSPVFAINHENNEENLKNFQGEGRMMGLNTGNDAADFEAGIW